MSPIKFCLFALFAIVFAVNLGDASPIAALDAELDTVLDAELEAAALDIGSVQPLDFATWRRKVENCVLSVNTDQLEQCEKLKLWRCRLSGLLGGPLVPEAIAKAYSRCVVKGPETEALKKAAMEVVNCVRAS